jgi:hypothetical protein
LNWSQSELNEPHVGLPLLIGSGVTDAAWTAGANAAEGAAGGPATGDGSSVHWVDPRVTVD